MNRRSFLNYACAFLWLALTAAPPLIAQKILYTTSQDGNDEIYVMNVDGSAARRLTYSPEDESSPRWSADGSAIYFFAQAKNGSGGSFGLRADGTGRKPVARLGEWSPDGLMTLISNQDGLAIRGIDDYGDSTFLYSGKASVDNIRWAPDSFHILFSSTVGNARFASTTLYVTDAYGGSPDRVGVDCSSPQLNCWLVEASWSPDGSKILVVQEGAILVFDAVPGTAPALLFKFERYPIYDAAWSPDGSQIAYITNANAGNSELFQQQVFAMNSSGGSHELLLDGPAGVEYTQLRYAPDGSKIVLDNPWSVLWDNSGPAAIYSVDTDGGNWRLLAANALFGDITASVAVAAPEVYAGGVVLSNLAPAVQSVSSLAIASIFGSGFSSGYAFSPSIEEPNKIRTKRTGSCVEIGGERAPILAITPTQVNIHVPASQNLGPVSVVVIRNCDLPGSPKSNVVTVNMEQATPAFFLYPPYTNDGWIAARHALDDVVVAPAGLYLESRGPSRPAKPGDVITLYGTGWGATSANLSTGELAPGPAPLLPSANAQVTLGGIPLAPENILYVGAAPGTAGLYQLNIRVPVNAGAGAKVVTLTVYGKTTPSGPVVPVITP